MGKPFETELQNLPQTYKWSLEVPIERLCYIINSSHNLPLITVGSGGSLTAAHMAALLHQRTGMVSRAVTPLDLISSGRTTQSVSILILSAGGHNSDILSAFRFAATCEPRQLMALCMRTESPLSALSREFRYTHFLDFNPPSGKDGFLATNSLVAFIAILIRVYNEMLWKNSKLPKNLVSTQDVYEQVNGFAQPLLEKNTWAVLYGRWGLPAAIDTESKFTEAALKNVQIADYRNFAHGRHHWLAKRGDETGVVALITPDEREIAEKTLNLLPKNIPQLRLVTDRTGPLGGLDLIIKILHLIHLVGTAQGIDPGMPRVPAFGRRIYHLHLPSYSNYFSLPSDMSHQEEIAILRKSKYSSLADMKAEDLEYWRESYRKYIRRMERTHFGTAVFDYDGTLCDPNERYIGLSHEISQELVRILRGGIVIGIATGRGKSVRKDLHRFIPKEYWERVLIGYYNGSDIASLADLNHPHKTCSLDASLQLIKESLANHAQFDHVAKYECRPKQITIQPLNMAYWERTKLILIDVIFRAKVAGIKVLESSHSIDVITPGVSKLHLVRACEEVSKQIGNPGIALCIGDKGEWPGNDYELLNTPYSLSVDTVSADPTSCWNLSQAGHRGVQATLIYLKSMEIMDGVLRLKRKRRTRNS